MNKRERVVAEAKKLIGVPYVHMGKTDRGLDCLGFIYLVYYRAGFDVVCGDGGEPYPVRWFYNKERYGERYYGGFIFNGFVEIPYDDILIGDVLVFRMFGKSCAMNHSGIVSAIHGHRDLNFIHCSGINRPGHLKVRTENLYTTFNPTYSKLLTCCFRHKDLM